MAAGVPGGSAAPAPSDPLLARLVVHAESRPAALARARAALADFPVLGVRTNGPFLLRLLAHPEFEAGRTHIGFVDEHRAALAAAPGAAERDLALAAACAAPAGPAASGAFGAPAAGDPAGRPPGRRTRR